ncbi:MAG TPA: hypothetical protein VHP38_16085 [Ruminiclostridium sp.]|nr:hypothetical protein [Ruminiclostridium sp.]
MLSRLKIAWSIMRGGDKLMVNVYVTLIVYTDRTGETIDSVPAALRPQVLAKLNAIGLDGYGKPLTNG